MHLVSGEYLNFQGDDIDVYDIIEKNVSFKLVMDREKERVKRLWVQTHNR
jgi:phenylacetic acid degradation operon negative regulatory protein